MYSPVKKSNNKHNNVFVKGYKFGLMTLEFKKFSDPNEDAYYKDFLDLLDTDPKVGNDLGIIKVAFLRDSSKCSIAKIQSSGYKGRHFLGIIDGEVIIKHQQQCLHDHVHSRKASQYWKQKDSAAGRRFNLFQGCSTYLGMQSKTT